MDLANELAELIAEALRENRPRFDAETVRAVDLGCFPWHGTLELSFLTTSEPGLRIERSPFTSVGDWRFYDVMPDWPAAKNVATAMRREWATSKDQRATADAYFRTCATALRSGVVGDALALYKRSTDFTLQVLNPDQTNSINYCATS